MTDLRQTIVPKSDQLNADDLIGATRTIKVTAVSLCKEPEQPIAINFEGDGGKPYKPCKSMRRVMVTIWGPDGNAYKGRSMTLYRDDKVLFGGLAVGGIRISHMSDITDPVTMALTATRANRRPFTVKPLVENAAPTGGSSPAGVRKQSVSEWMKGYSAKLASARTPAELTTLMAADETAIKLRDKGSVDQKAAVAAAEADARAALERPAPRTPQPGEHDYIEGLDDDDGITSHMET